MQACASEVLKSALDGYNGTVMCYGQTGAGKTYTMSGGKSTFKQRGIIPRMISHLYAEMRAMSDRRFKVQVQYLEIYNEQLFDLLDITTAPHELNIYENARTGGMWVGGLKCMGVESEAEALGLLFEVGGWAGGRESGWVCAKTLPPHCEEGAQGNHCCHSNHQSM